MAVLGDAQRREVWADFMRRVSDERQSVAITKNELRAAIDAAGQDTGVTRRRHRRSIGALPQENT